MSNRTVFEGTDGYEFEVFTNVEKGVTFAIGEHEDIQSYRMTTISIDDAKELINLLESLIKRAE